MATPWWNGADSFAKANKKRGLRLFFGRPAGGDECEADGVDTIPLPRRRRAIVKNMAQMRLALPAADFGAEHSMRAVLNKGKGILRHRIVEAGPPGPGIKFCPGGKQRGATDGATVRTVGMMVPIGPGEGSFGPTLLGYPSKFVGKRGAHMENILTQPKSPAYTPLDTSAEMR